MCDTIKRAVTALGIVACAIGAPLPVLAASPLYSTESLLAPVWEGSESYQESVLAVEEEDGSLAPVDLLYPIEEIRSVTSASLDKTYRQGVDYDVADGQLVILDGGSIPRLTYAEFYPETGTPGFEDRDGGYVLWKEGSWYHERQIAVTYTHTQPYSGYIPEGKGNLLKTLRSKLVSDGSLELLVYGDSISEGGNSSGSPLINVSPYMPIYPELFAEGLKLRYGLRKVNVHNASVGGKDSNWGVSDIRSQVLDKYDRLDLAIVAFGMNDTTRDAQSYAYNIKRIVSALTKKYEGIAVLMVAPMLPNERAVTFWGHQAEFYDELKKLEQDGAVSADVTGIHKSLLQTKRYADMTGNNINHANDYLARIYAQTLLRTLEVSEYGGEPAGEGDGNIAPVTKPKGLSNGAIAGIAAGSVVAAGAAVAAAVLYRKKKKR